MPEELKPQPQVDIEGKLESMLAPLLEGVASQMKLYVTEQLKPITDRIALFEQPQQPKTTKEDPLTNRISLLEAQLKEQSEKLAVKETEASNLRFTQALSSAVGDKVLHKDLVTEVLQKRLQDGSTEKDGTWFTKDGQKLAEAVSGFFSSEQGKHFIPSNAQSGVGTKQPGLHLGTDRNTKDMTLAEVFSNVQW